MDFLQEGTTMQYFAQRTHNGVLCRRQTQSSPVYEDTQGNLLQKGDTTFVNANVRGSRERVRLSFAGEHGDARNTQVCL